VFHCRKQRPGRIHSRSQEIVMAHAQAETGRVVERPGEHWRRPDVAQMYDDGRFDNLKGRLYRWREERVIELALRRLPRGGTVLDAACGTGRITALLQRNGLRATGTDISLAMMAVAHRRLASLGYEVPLVESSVERLPYPDQSFDAATCVGLLMHLDADVRVRALRELARVSRGPLVVQYGCVDVFQRLSARITGVPPGQVRCPVSEQEMQMDLLRSGLRPLAQSWVMRGLSSSLIVVLTTDGIRKVTDRPCGS
jgi:ubiquinone/menaquinone biosynthesis C-methylase UbiE